MESCSSDQKGRRETGRYTGSVGIGFLLRIQRFSDSNGTVGRFPRYQDLEPSMTASLRNPKTKFVAHGCSTSRSSRVLAVPGNPPREINGPRLFKRLIRRSSRPVSVSNLASSSLRRCVSQCGSRRIKKTDARELASQTQHGRGTSALLVPHRRGSAAKVSSPRQNSQSPRSWYW